MKYLREWPLCWICFCVGIEAGIRLERRGGWGWMCETFLAYFVEWLRAVQYPPFNHIDMDDDETVYEAVTAAAPFVLTTFSWPNAGEAR